MIETYIIVSRENTSEGQELLIDDEEHHKGSSRTRREMLLTRPEPFKLSKTNFNKSKYASNYKFSDRTLIKFESSIKHRPKRDSISAITIQGQLAHTSNRVKPKIDEARKENQIRLDLNNLPEVYLNRPKVIVKTQEKVHF
jgi:hypothetical protein